MCLFKLVFSPDICPGVGLQDHMVALFLVFKGTSKRFSIVAAPIYIPTSSVGGFPFLHTLKAMILKLNVVRYVISYLLLVTVKGLKVVDHFVFKSLTITPLMLIQ